MAAPAAPLGIALPPPPPLKRRLRWLFATKFHDFAKDFKTSVIELFDAGVNIQVFVDDNGYAEWSRCVRDDPLTELHTFSTNFAAPDPVTHTIDDKRNCVVYKFHVLSRGDYDMIGYERYGGVPTATVKAKFTAAGTDPLILGPVYKAPLGVLVPPFPFLPLPAAGPPRQILPWRIIDWSTMACERCCRTASQCCPHCNKTPYCSKACRKEAWPFHKRSCVKSV